VRTVKVEVEFSLRPFEVYILINSPVEFDSSLALCGDIRGVV
jgi:hypothetical protein